MELTDVNQVLGDIISASVRLNEATIEHNSNKYLLLYLNSKTDYHDDEIRVSANFGVSVV
jgi:hypothetical protein